MKIGDLNIRGAKLGTSNVNLYLGDKILYKELEYIETTRRQSINILTPEENSIFWENGSYYTIKIKTYVYSNQEQVNSLDILQALLSICWDYGPTLYHNTSSQGGLSGLSWKFPSVSLDYFEWVNPVLDSRYRQTKILNFNTTGEIVVDYKRTNTENSEYSRYGITLFGRSIIENNNTNADRLIKAKLYYCQVYKRLPLEENATLIVDLIPVLTFKGEIGLYDKVNNRFTMAYEGVPFIAGPEV